MALCLAFLFTPLLSKAQTLDPTQIYTTGNIVQDTPQGGPTPWVNGVYQDQLTCWGWGDPGYCGPNAIVRPGGNINFSYGSTYLYQQQHISTLLPSITGLQVNGYNFGFTAKNGNGWDDGRTDNLMALVRFWDNTGGKSADNLLYGNVYSLNYKFNWTTFNYSETFTKPLSVPSIGQVQYGFIGSDNNGWAGPYGPEIYNVNFSLKYSVDPCVTNIFSSPSCPGYLDAIAKLTPQPTMTGVTTETTPVGTTTLVDSVLISPTGTYGSLLPPAPDTTQPPSLQQSGPLPPGPAMPGPTQQASTTQPSSTQTRIGEVSDSGGGSKSTVSLSSVLSMISSNQEKTAALEKSVVQAADAQAFSAGDTAKQQAEKLAGDVQSQSIANSGGTQSGGVAASATQLTGISAQGSAISTPGNLQSSAAANSARLQQSINSSNIGSQTENTLSFNATVQQQYNIQSTSRQDLTVAMTSPQVSYSLFSPTRIVPQVQIELPATEGIKFGYRGPLDNIMDSRPVMPQASTSSQQADTVRKNVQNNDAAGNVTIDSIAKQPANYAQYFNAMPDIAFYAPKEIYRNQKVVDNQRTLRQMNSRSDRIHQEMVNQQYKN